MVTLFKKIDTDFFFRLGLSGIFLTSSLTAWFAPDEFIELLEHNQLALAIASPEQLVSLIGLNDFLLFGLILSGKWRKLVAAWAILWLLIVIYVTGFRTPEFIEHLAILSLVTYHYLSSVMSRSSKQV